MRKLLSLSLVAMLALTAVVSSCSKYDEGPKFTLLTAKMRVTGNWEMIKVTYNGSDITSFNPKTKLDIVKDGSYTKTYTSGSFSITETGTWKFNSDKTDLIFTDSSNDVTTFKIIQLKNKDMKLKYTDSDGNETVTTYQQ